MATFEYSGTGDPPYGDMWPTATSLIEQGYDPATYYSGRAQQEYGADPQPDADTVMLVGQLGLRAYTDTERLFRQTELSDGIARMFGAFQNNGEYRHPERDAEITQMYYGIPDRQQHTIKEIAEVMGLTPTTVAYIIDKTLRRLQIIAVKYRLGEFLETQPSKRHAVRQQSIPGSSSTDYQLLVLPDDITVYIRSL